MGTEQKTEVMVSLGGNIVGWQFGESFDLGELLAPQAAVQGENSYRDVYIRTRSGNIYRIDTSFEIVNMRESARLKAIHKSILLPEYLIGGRGIIKVGDPFDYYVSATHYGSQPELAGMSDVAEIIATKSRRYSQEKTLQMCEGRTSTILLDYQRGMQAATSFKGRRLGAVD